MPRVQAEHGVCDDYDDSDDDDDDDDDVQAKHGVWRRDECVRAPPAALLRPQWLRLRPHVLPTHLLPQALLAAVDSVQVTSQMHRY